MTLHHFRAQAPFALENGSVFRGIDIAFHTYGRLNSDKSNVIWVCHALTGSSDVLAWWPGLVGSGTFFDPAHWYIVCANVLGSPYGSTSPISLNPLTGKSYLLDFPTITIRDMVKAHRLLAEHLGIEQISLLIGGSMGGQQALEWAIDEPCRIRQLVLMATNAVGSPWGIAFNESQRLALLADNSFDGINPDGGMAGLMAARSVALLSYRCFDSYRHTQSEDDRHKVNHFLAAAYQRHQGEKFVRRFNAYCYWCLLNSLDTHNIGRKRNKPEIMLSKVAARTLVIGITSDLLFPVSEQQYLAWHIKNAQFVKIDSRYGHDGFLTEIAALEKHLLHFLSGQDSKRGVATTGEQRG